MPTLSSILACRIPWTKETGGYSPQSHTESDTAEATYSYQGDSWVFVELSSFPGGSDGKASAYNLGDPGSIPGLGKSPGYDTGNERKKFIEDQWMFG